MADSTWKPAAGGISSCPGDARLLHLENGLIVPLHLTGQGEADGRPPSTWHEQLGETMQTDPCLFKPPTSEGKSRRGSSELNPVPAE